jgi:ankyrin repeat protein
LYSGNSHVANTLINMGATLTKKCYVMPQGSGPYSYFQVHMNETIELFNTNEVKVTSSSSSSLSAFSTDAGRRRIFLNYPGLGTEGKLKYCDVTTGPADCHITLFDPPISFMTVSRLGIQMRQGKSEFIEDDDTGWTKNTNIMSHYKSVDYSWNKITKIVENIKKEEIERQRRLVIAEQVERTQRIGRIKMTKAVHSYEFEEVLRLVDEEEIAIDIETLWGYTALGLAASEGTEGLSDEGVQVLAVEMLLDRPTGKIRPAVNREINGMTPLMWAANHGHVDVAESLISRGAIVNYISEQYAPPHILPPPGAFEAEAAAAAAMIQEELTALIRMYPAGSSEAEKALVEVAEEIAKAAQRSSHSKNRLKNGDLNKNDDDDDDDDEKESNDMNIDEEDKEDSLYQNHKTPLIVATCAGHKKMVWLLLQYGADQTICDSTGRNALQWASSLGNHELMQLLAQSRANFFGDARSSEGRASHISCGNGCGARIAPKLVDYHEKNECPKRIVPCPYSLIISCGSDELWAEEIEEHKITCSNRPVKCDLCNESIHLLSLKNHLKNECTDRFIQCPYNCGKNDLKEKMKEQHCKLWCKRRPIECTNSCGETVPYNEVLIHKRVCLRRQVRCMLGCGDEMPYEERDHHQNKLCSKRWVPCKWKKCEGTSANRLIIHEKDECNYREILCVCNNIILGMDYLSHLKNHCQKRMVPCRHRKCNMRFMYENKKNHEKTDCQQRWVSCYFHDISKQTELGPDINEINETDEMYNIIESLAISLKMKDIDDLDSRIHRVVGCGSKVRLSEMEEHWKNDCKSREVLCGSGCGASFCYGASDYHKKNTCLKRDVTCHLGCMQITKAEDLKHHEERICKFRKVYCSLGCNTIMYEYTRKKHEHENCILRFVDCTNNCGATMRYEDLNTHLMYSCEMREYVPPIQDFTCKRCNMENLKNKMITEYGNNVFEWRCSVCKLPPFQKGISVSVANNRKKKKGESNGFSTNLFG